MVCIGVTSTITWSAGAVSDVSVSVVGSEGVCGGIAFMPSAGVGGRGVSAGGMFCGGCVPVVSVTVSVVCGGTG
ncbi:MAG: hypothetical protein K2P63_04845 [Lachnospiraceae bacterium]|nr:hypothetical protein [Lachnospiraceae bacterium]